MSISETQNIVEQKKASVAADRRELFGNEQVVVIETRYPVGSTVLMHTHQFPHVIYVIQGGTLQKTAPDGTTETLELRPRETLWAHPTAHSTRNIGATPVRILEVEIKNATRTSELMSRVRKAGGNDLNTKEGVS